MTDNEIRKATDNDIIKALEDWLKNFEGKAVDYMKISFALDLINRQKAEIKALQMDNKQLETDNCNANMNCEHLQAEIERLEKGSLKEAMTFNSKTIAKATAEAVKEFAERIKENTFTYSGEIRIYDAVMVEWIDKCVKEMVGAESGS